MKKLIIAALLISLFLFGCALKQPVAPETTGDTDVDDVSSEISDVDTIDDDLSGEELDNLEKDLENLDW